MIKPSGTKEFFRDYIINQIEKEDKTASEVIARIHFAFTQLIFESQPIKDSVVMIKNLTEVCEELSSAKL